MRIQFRIFLLLLIGSFTSCIRNEKTAKETPYANPADTINLFQNKVDIKYASGFKVEYFPTYKKVQVLDPQNPGKPFGKYLLVERGRPYEAASDEVVIEIPVLNLACVSTTHLPFLSHLDLEDKLVGFSGMRYVKDEKILKRIKEGKVKEIGTETDLNKESIVDLYPEMLMVYPYEGMDFSSLKKAGIPIVYNSDYLEMSPLGKAEWIKFFALFFNKEEEANHYFSFVEEEYNSLLNKAKSAQRKPAIFSGKAFNGEWHVPGGKSFAAAMMQDAGAVYLWGDDAHNNVLQLEMEHVVEKALHAEWWIIVGANNGKYTLDKLQAEDSRYAEFDAFKNKQVLFCNTFESDYFGEAVAEPQIVLKDLVYFLHPELVKNYKPKYFYRLQ
ncbi:MAG: ABC transporter substrate-binding protein [Flavobacteriales bacterium]|nr:ABC transporter substrate-binding protein [Flavobacteriales bacterium]